VLYALLRIGFTEEAARFFLGRSNLPVTAPLP